MVLWGVLKAELDFLLGRYDNIDFRKVIIKKYGQGATEVLLNKTVNKMRLKKSPVCNYKWDFFLLFSK
jgi:hypothetical protein